MTHFDLNALDGGRPDYPPGLTVSKGICYWRAPRTAVKAGYSFTRTRLPGRLGDGGDLERAALCREYTREALRWLNNGDETKFSRDTWGWLVMRYLSDELSPYREVKANTRETYAFSLNRWQDMVGTVTIATTDYRRIKGWQKAMKDKDRSPAYIKRMFTMLRIVAGYGKALKVEGAAEVKDILGEIRVGGTKPRTAAPTKAQIEAIIAKADEAGDVAFALGLSLQWWLTLRAADVRGQWLRIEKGEAASGIVRNGFRWADGLTWDMIDRNVTTATKVPSKTADASPEALVFDLTLIPDLRARLMAVPVDQRVGPVIVDPKTGLPFRKERWSAKFRDYRDAAGLPDTIWMMDTRAGAINDAKRAGATKIEMQAQANHASGATTEQYIREKSDTANKVIQIRSGTSSN